VMIMDGYLQHPALLHEFMRLRRAGHIHGVQGTRAGQIWLKRATARRVCTPTRGALWISLSNHRARGGLAVAVCRWSRRSRLRDNHGPVG
jgi:hypothetical protein